MGLMATLIAHERKKRRLREFALKAIELMRHGLKKKKNVLII